MDVTTETIGTRLPIRLSRVVSRKSEQGCRVFLAFLLIGLPIGLGIPIINHWGEEGSVLAAIVVGAFGLVGLLLLYVSIHQAFAARIPETIVEIERVSLQPGDKVQVCIRQPGPVSLHSLRANLTCEESVRRVGSKGRISHSSRLIYQQNFLDIQDAMISAGDTLEQMVILEIPIDAKPSSDRGATKINWRIEVWGKVEDWPGFMHPFSIRVQ